MEKAKRSPQAADVGRQFHQPARASRLRIASAAQYRLGGWPRGLIKVVARIELISRATRTHGSRYGS